MGTDNKSRGYRRHYRSLMLHPLHPLQLGRKFTKYEALLDIFDSAAGTEKKVVVNSEILKIPRGSWFTSYRKLAERWHWSRSAVQRFLAMLVKDGCLSIVSKPVQEAGHLVGTLLQVNNYQEYNPLTQEPDIEMGQVSGTGSGTDARHSRDARETKLNKERKEIQILCGKVVAHLNSRAGTKYKPTSDVTLKHIRARAREGYGLEDFKRVNDVKVREWLGTDKQKYLRPETLYCAKHFEGYRNQALLEEKHGAPGKSNGNRPEPRYKVADDED